MLHVAAEHSHHAPGVVVVCAALLVGLGVVVPALLAARTVLTTRRALRRCPRCGARAVREVSWQAVGTRPSRVALQCGQCATWRRVLAADGDRRAQQRHMRRDRRRIERRLDVLHAESESDALAPPRAGSLSRTATPARRSTRRGRG